jgi:hypothetical protein
MLLAMSVAEMKREAIALPEAERRELSAFLLQLGRERNEGWRQELSRRMQDMDAGKKVSQQEFERRAGLTAN